MPYPVVPDMGFMKGNDRDAPELVSVVVWVGVCVDWVGVWVDFWAGVDPSLLFGWVVVVLDGVGVWSDCEDFLPLPEILVHPAIPVMSARGAVRSNVRRVGFDSVSGIVLSERLHSVHEPCVVPPSNSCVSSRPI
jgi:hypothetical protein